MSPMCVLHQLLLQPQQAGEGLLSFLTPQRVRCPTGLRRTYLVLVTERAGTSLGFGTELCLTILSSKKP